MAARPLTRPGIPRIFSGGKRAGPPAERGAVRQSPGYRNQMHALYRHVVPPGAAVLEVGCGTGDLLAGLQVRRGHGIDRDAACITAARRAHNGNRALGFSAADVETTAWAGHDPYDYIILSDVLPALRDVQRTFENLHAVCTPATRLVMNFPSNLWRPVLRLATRLRLREPDAVFNWLSLDDVRNLLYLAGFEVVTSGYRVLLPLRIPLLYRLCNRLLARLPLVEKLSLAVYVVARPRPAPRGEGRGYGVSVVIPTRNERGTIEAAFRRTPSMGAWTELIFVDGASSDGTVAEIERCRERFGASWRRVELLRQDGDGKGQAVRQGFAACRGDILMILDSDLTMPPETLPKYYAALAAGRGEFINGCRLVYQKEKEAMRFLNMVANHLFALLFSWLLGQRVKDTLCGTKVLWRRDYVRIAEGRSYFGELDPFGDFDLLFGAARFNRKIVDMPIRYAGRRYGEIEIRRWRHGWLLLRMVLVAARKLKFA
ncbi:MAG: glycosyltransferase [Lentisphaerae bacterium]|nr:glycosyltransferase [Lentisphaerota bacterium]